MTPLFHSRFGGMWIDRADFDEILQTRLRSRSIRPVEAAHVREFAAHGYTILPRAAPQRAVDSFRAAIEASFREGNSALLYQEHGSQITRNLDRPVPALGARVVDSYVALPQALALLALPALRRFLSLVFNEAPLLFQSLSFDQGSQQGLHQDTAYVVVDRPMELAACWIALEDVRPGSGELMYVPGSHRLPDFPFGDRKTWDRDVDGDAPHYSWSRWIVTESAARGLTEKRFLARQGDILVWHADLAHGGAPITDAALTRRSLVGHFCPASARPRYFDHGPRRATVRRAGGLAYASGHYDLAAAAAPAAARRARPGLLDMLFGEFGRRGR